jgi:hypothetical protein
MPKTVITFSPEEIISIIKNHTVYRYGGGSYNVTFEIDPGILDNREPNLTGVKVTKE